MSNTATVLTDDLLKQKAVQYLDHLEAGIKTGGEFVATQAPDVIREMLAYHVIDAACGLLFGLALLGTGLAILRWLCKNWDRINDKSDGSEVPVIAGCGFAVGILLLVSPMCICPNASILLQCCLAPKYFVLHQILMLAK